MGRGRVLKGSVWWSAFPSFASVALKSRESERQCEKYFLCSEPRTQRCPPSSRSISGRPSSQTQAVRPLTIHNRFTWKFLCRTWCDQIWIYFHLLTGGVTEESSSAGMKQVFVQKPVTEIAPTISWRGGTLPSEKSCSYMENGRRLQGGGGTLDK